MACQRTFRYHVGHQSPEDLKIRVTLRQVRDCLVEPQRLCGRQVPDAGRRAARR